MLWLCKFCNLKTHLYTCSRRIWVNPIVVFLRLSNVWLCDGHGHDHVKSANDLNRRENHSNERENGLNYRANDVPFIFALRYNLVG